MPVLPEGQMMWIAYVAEIDSVTIVEKGTGGRVFKRGSKPKNPYVVDDGEEQFVVSYDELYDSPTGAALAAAKMAKEHGLEPNPPEADREGNPKDLEEEEEEDEDGEEEDQEDGTEEEND